MGGFLTSSRLRLDLVGWVPREDCLGVNKKSVGGCLDLEPALNQWCWELEDCLVDRRRKLGVDYLEGVNVQGGSFLGPLQLA